MGQIVEHILSIIALMPLAGAALIVCMPSRMKLEIRVTAIAASAATLILALALASTFAGTGDFEFGMALAWVPSLGISYRVGIDGISLAMILLTTILVPAAMAASWHEIDRRIKAFYALILVLETGLIGTFMALDAFLFYVFWEAVLIPMYFIIGVWGSGNRIRSAITFVIFTAAGSLVMLVAILYCSAAAGGTFDIVRWYGHPFAVREQMWLFAAFALAFAIKLPVIPLHTWLPDAHSDAPTAGSVLLAGVLLKMGAYGFLRFAMPLFPSAVLFYARPMMVLGAAAIIYAGLLALVQSDMKRLIAYSSVAHMGFVVLGLFALSPIAMQGAVIQLVTHGLITGGLFMMTGMIYGRTHTRAIADYGGAARAMPVLASCFIVLAIASAGLPGLAAFVGEFMVLLGAFQTRTFYAAAAIPGVIIAAVYMLRLVQRVFFGPCGTASARVSGDLDVREHLAVVPLIALVVLIGIWPQPLLGLIGRSTDNVLALSMRGITTAPARMTVDTDADALPEPDTVSITAEPMEDTLPVHEPDADVDAGASEGDASSGVEIPQNEMQSLRPRAERVTLPPLPRDIDQEDSGDDPY